jgi:phosphatidylglycerophosphate synthase
MQLHHTSGQPDWQAIAPGQRSGLQRVAAKTQGVITPGNFVTVIGFGLVVWGFIAIVGKHYWIGLVLVLAGRLADLLDGWLAQATATKSPVGELLDATADKLCGLVALITLYSVAIVPHWVLAAIFLPQITISLVAIIDFVGKQQHHPAHAGKVSMALSWTSLCGFVLLQAMDTTNIAAQALFALCAVAAAWLGIQALLIYRRERS